MLWRSGHDTFLKELFITYGPNIAFSYSQSAHSVRMKTNGRGDIKMDRSRLLCIMKLSDLRNSI